MIEPKELNEMNLETVEKEIKSRQELMEQMVGWLYPSILQGELEQLYIRRKEVEHGRTETGSGSIGCSG